MAALRNRLVLLYGAALVLLITGPVDAQPFPVPRVAVMNPPGGRSGTFVEVTVSGADLDEASDLLFSHPALKVARITPPPPKMADPKDKKAPSPAAVADPRFKVAIAPEVPPGTYDVRLVGKWGVSNPRAFVVGDRPEVLEKEANNDVDKAQRIELGTIINGSINPKPDVDYYVFPGKKGQRIVVHAAAFSIDSKLNPFLQVFNDHDRELASNLNYRDREAVLDCVLPADGDYHVRICEFTYIGAGPDYFYRLSVSDAPWIDAVYPPVVEFSKPAVVSLFGRNLPEGTLDLTALLAKSGKPLDKQLVKFDPATRQRHLLQFAGTLWPRAVALDGFEFRVKNHVGISNPALIGFTDQPVVLDNEDNDTPAKAQAITPPVDICGRIERPRDRDWYVFSAKKGDIYVIEGFADRLRSPIDLYFQWRKRASNQLTEVDDHADMAPIMGRVFTRTEDPKARWEAPEDGEYELQIRSRTADMRGGARHIYRLSLRREQPDFHLLVVDNNDASTGGCTVRRGGSQDLEVYCFRRDGFEGEVTLSVDGLPPGVNCPPQVLGPKLDRTVLVVSATSDAHLWTGNIRVQGTAIIGGHKAARAGRPGCIVWPAPNNVPAISRLGHSLALAVREKGPFSLSTPVAELAVPVGGTLAVKFGVNPLFPDFKVPVALDVASAPAQPNGKFITVPKLTIAAGQKEGEVKIPVPANTVPGTYNLVFRGQAKYAFAEDPKAKKKTVDVVQVTPPIKLVVFDRFADLTMDTPNLTIPVGGEGTLHIQLKRLHGYKGDFKVTLDLPKNATGIQVAETTVAPNADQAKLVVRVAPKTKTATLMNVPVKAVARFDKLSLTAQASLSIQIVEAKGAAPTRTVKEVKILPAGEGGWKYALAAMVQGEDWTRPEFKDGSWNVIRTPLGNGEPEIEARKGTLLAEKGQSIVLRKIFDMPLDILKQKDTTFKLSVASDDSATVYVNGTKVDDDVSDHEFQYWNREVSLKAEHFRPGPNLIAVVVRNGAGSSDLYFDLELTAEKPVDTANK